MCFWKKKKEKEEAVKANEVKKSEAKVVKNEENVAAKEAKKSTEKPIEKVSVKEETSVKETPVKAEKSLPAKNKDEKNNDAVKKESFKYHISQNKDDKSEFFKQWRVRKSGSDKTIKYFKTQKEAISYAKQLADNNDASIVIHKEDGSIRKQNYAK